jgi:ABC-type spermidine/putrescine transport system permease subunit II
VGIAFATTALAFVVGSILGLWAALTGGWLDQVLSRFVDALMAIPALIFSLLLLTIFRTSVLSLILVIAAVDATRVFRLARSVAQGIVVMDYIEAAKLRGEGAWFLIRREILPNAMAPLVAEFGLRFCFVFLSISSLSFLGLGIKPPTADWGSMVRDNATLITFGDVTPLLPAGCIALLTVAVNFVVDWQLHRASGLREGEDDPRYLLKIEGLRIEGRSGDTWSEIVKGVDLTLHKGEVLGLIGESRRGQIHRGSGRDGLCPRRLPHHGRHHRVRRDRPAPRPEAQRRGAPGQAHRLCRAIGGGQFQPRASADRAICRRPVIHGVMARDKAERMQSTCTARCSCPTPRGSAFAIRIRCRAGNCSAR